jgi:hyperosmotically inducible periplasmic protein
MKIQRNALSVLMPALLLVGMGAAGCKGTVEKNEQGEVTSVGVKTDPEVTQEAKEAGHDMADATHEAGQDLKEGAMEAGAAAEQGLDNAGEAMKEGAAEAKEATADTNITAKIKTKLLADPEVGGLAINVDTVNGKVTLTGTAKTKAQKNEAGKLAKNTEGVTDVVNDIVVTG